MKIREYEIFRGVYCGLCHTLRSRYGPLLRFAVNYDLTFLAMLLADTESCETTPRRCPYHPLRKAVCPRAMESLDAAADITVILAYWKLRDAAEDESFFKAAGSRLLAAVIRSAYKRAAAVRPDFAEATAEELAELHRMEEASCSSLDAAADRFARILRLAAGAAQDQKRRRILEQLLYHLGRIIYVLDAADDLPEDERTGAYNPLRFRYELLNGRLGEEDESQLRQSLQLSHNFVSSAFQLLDRTPYTDILSNIIYFGLPAVTRAVFSGEWRALKRGKKERSLDL